MTNSIVVIKSVSQPKQLKSKLLMLHIYHSICRAYCLVVDDLPSGAIRYLWSMKDIIYAGPKMLKKWFYWVVIGRRIFCFMTYFCLQSSLIKTSSSRTEDHIVKILSNHKYTKLQYYKKILEVVLLLMIPFMLIVSPFLWQMFCEKNELEFAIIMTLSVINS